MYLQSDAGAFESQSDGAMEEIPIDAAALINYGQSATTVHGGMHQYIANYLNRLGSIRRYDSKYLDNEYRSFVDPGFTSTEVDLTRQSPRMTVGDVAARLRSDRCIVLVGEPGTGRHLTGLMLLAQIGQQVWRLRASIDQEEGNGANIDNLAIPERSCCLLEIPEQAGGLTCDLDHAVSNYLDTLRDRHSFFVIVLTGRLWKLHGRRTEAPVFWMATPDSRSVFQKHLAVADLPADVSGELGVSQLALLAERLAVADAVRLAGHTITTVQSIDGVLDSDRVISQTLAAFHRWEEDLAIWFDSHHGIRERLFLIVASVFHGLRGDFLHAMTGDLARALDEKAFVRGGISEPGVRQLSLVIGAEVTSERTIAFKRPGYAEAVIDFLTYDRDEQFQRDLWRWVAELPTRKGLGYPAAFVADRVARLLLETALRLRDERIVKHAVEQWPRVPALQEPLQELLTVLAISPDLGPTIRLRLYDLARRKTDPRLLKIIVGICGGEFGQLFPGLALKRLELVAAHSIELLEIPVCGSYVMLWSHPRIRKLIVVQLAEWLAGEDLGLYTQAGQILAALARSASAPANSFIVVALQCERATIQQVACGISKLLDFTYVARTMLPVFAHWFRSACGDPVLAEGLITLFIMAVFRTAGIERRLSHVEAALHLWAPVADIAESDAQAVFREYFLRRLREADVAVRHSRELDAA